MQTHTRRSLSDLAPRTCNLSDVVLQSADARTPCADMDVMRQLSYCHRIKLGLMLKKVASTRKRGYKHTQCFHGCRTDWRILDASLASQDRLPLSEVEIISSDVVNVSCERSIPCWSTGHDSTLSQPRTGFDSRTGNTFLRHFTSLTPDREYIFAWLS